MVSGVYARQTVLFIAGFSPYMSFVLPSKMQKEIQNDGD